MRIGPFPLAWVALVLIIVSASLVALRLGAQTVLLTETDIIDYYSAHYLENEKAEGRGAELTDCYALAGVALWERMEVICQPQTAAPYRYHVGYWGQLLHFSREIPHDPAPKA